MEGAEFLFLINSVFLADRRIVKSSLDKKLTSGAGAEQHRQNRTDSFGDNDVKSRSIGIIRNILRQIGQNAHQYRPAEFGGSEILELVDDILLTGFGAIEQTEILLGFVGANLQPFFEIFHARMKTNRTRTGETTCCKIGYD